MGLNYIKGVNLGNWLVLEKWDEPGHCSMALPPTTNITCRRSSTRPSMRHASKRIAPNTSTNATSPPSNHGD